ncbi:MAG TPA: amino acid adenylation domain-containing protein, partial [Thermoanaerobaculia bacterium]|nr:amino acid adenylation domain-containing protein [Thermoanaerobaculia bacterium]
QRQWLSGERLAREIGYWRERLAGVTPLALATDHPRPAVRTSRGANRRLVLGEEIRRGLAALARRQRATLFMAGLSGFVALLARHSGARDLTVGTPVAGRARAELENLIGFFVNTLVLRFDLSGDPTFEELLIQAREASLGAFAHQEVPFEKVVGELQPERSLSRSPLFQVLFSLQSAPASGLDVAGLESSLLVLPSETAKFDLSLAFSEVGSMLYGGVEYNRDLFDRPTVERLCAHLEVLLAEVIAEPRRRLSQLALLAAGERHQLLAEWNDTAGGEPGELLVHRLLEEQVRRSPEARAVVWGEEVWSYGHLNGWANRLARLLRSRGLRPGERVGVAVRRSPWMVASVLAVLKAGGSYLPLDPSYPVERLAYMLEDSGVRLVVSEEGLLGAAWLAGRRLVRVDGERAALGRQQARDLDLPVDPRSAAYAIYTSGSTGRPKGVEVSHGSLASLLATMRERPGLGSLDVVAAVTALSFDIAGLELYLPLSVGAGVVLASEEESGDGWRLQRRLATSAATVLQATPATWRMLLEAGWAGDPALRVLCGGEAMGEGLARELTRYGCEVWNLYGPTETTVWSTVAAVREGERVTIGRAVGRTTAYVLSEALEAVPIGVWGELSIGGSGVAQGYLGRPELTAERFVPSPFGEGGERLYRTGDIVRRLADGRLEHLGRGDQQV